MGHANLSEKFYKGLSEKENITKEEFIQYNFICCGIFVPDNDSPAVNEQLIPKYEKCFEMSHQPIKYISHELYKKIKHRYIYKRNCVCGQYITKNCFIYSISSDILLNIGICCNEHFNENAIKKFCNLCGVHHRNTKNNFCNGCRSKIHLNCAGCGKDKSSSIKYLFTKLCYTCKFGENKYYNCKGCGKSKNEYEQKYPLCIVCNES